MKTPRQIESLKQSLRATTKLPEWFTAKQYAASIGPGVDEAVMRDLLFKIIEDGAPIEVLFRFGSDPDGSEGG